MNKVKQYIKDHMDDFQWYNQSGTFTYHTGKHYNDGYTVSVTKAKVSVRYRGIVVDYPMPDTEHWDELAAHHLNKVLALLGDDVGFTVQTGPQE